MTDKNFITKSVILYYFSGTGNTEYVAKLAFNAFTEAGFSARLAEITDYDHAKNRDYSCENYDLAGLFYPIHAFNAPKKVNEWTKLGYLKNKPFFIIKTSREALSANDASSLLSVKNLKAYGCEFLGEKHILMPYNIHFRHDDSLVKQMLLTAQTATPEFIKKILQGKKFALNPAFHARLAAATLRPIEQNGASLIGRALKAGDNCTACGLCAKICPNKNISMITDESKRNRPFFGKECMICMRCVMNCPQKAIKITRYLRGWEVCGRYDFKKILEDEKTSPNYITENYCGAMKKSYIKYFLDRDSIRHH